MAMNEIMENTALYKSQKIENWIHGQVGNILRQRIEVYFHGTSNRVTETTHLKEGDLVDVIQGNAINVHVFVKGGLYPVDVDPAYIFNIERLEHGQWRLIDACENDPYEMIEHDILQEGDIIRFVDSNNDDEVLYVIPELDLSDMSGVFIVARSLDDVESEMLDRINDVIGDNEDDEADDDNYTLDDLSLVPATPIIEYLKRYGQAIQIAANAIDDMDARYEDK